jgi:GNAT superfamily N-acetyltransferase
MVKADKEPAKGRSAKKTAPAIRLQDFEKKIRVRQITMEDFDALVELQKQCFEGMQAWHKEQIESQLLHFPAGQLCIEYKGQIVASSSSLAVDYDSYKDWHNRREISAGGTISNHDPEGDTLYGIEIMVHPKFRGLKLARRLYEARKALARRMNLSRIIIGGRIPGYGEHADEMSARDYVEKVMRRGMYDPVLTTQIANGFVLKRLIQDYLPSDIESRGYATFLEWTNLDFVPDPKRRSQTVSLVRLCAVQYQMRLIQSFEDFATQCEYFIDTASEKRSDFVIFPELLTTQLLSFLKARTPLATWHKASSQTPASPWVNCCTKPLATQPPWKPS